MQELVLKFVLEKELTPSVGFITQGFRIPGGLDTNQSSCVSKGEVASLSMSKFNGRVTGLGIRPIVIDQYCAVKMAGYWPSAVPF